MAKTDKTGGQPDEAKAICEREDQARSRAAETVRVAAEISQALWAATRDILIHEAAYPTMIVVAEHSLYRRLLTLADRGWVGGWGFADPAGQRLAAMIPSGVADVVGSSTMAEGGWMVVRAIGVDGAAGEGTIGG